MLCILRHRSHVSGYFWKLIFFIRFGLASTRRQHFLSPRAKLFANALQSGSVENAGFMLSCGRMKTELSESADVTAHIYDVSEHAHGSLGITQGHFDFFSFWTRIFSKKLLTWTRIFLYG